MSDHCDDYDEVDWEDEESDEEEYDEVDWEDEDEDEDCEDYEYA